MRSLRYGIPFLALASVPLGFLIGGPWSWLTIVATPVALVGLDSLLGSDGEAAPGGDAWGYRLLPWLYIPLQIALIVWAARAVAAPGVGWPRALGLTASVGLSGGVFGMLAAHEMVHSRRRAERGLGVAMLAAMGYAHFRIAHIHGHHRRAATWDDPASARLGETVFAFVSRSVAGQWREAWAFERTRLARGGHPHAIAGNRMVQYLVVEAGVAALFAALGPVSLAFWLAQAALAVILLEMFNYVAHYGLTRRRAPSGAVERIAPRHSWNASRRMNNWSLFNMGRHADHHRSGSREYQRLESLPASPELPCGYAGAVLLALAPPLWRRVMDPRAAAWATPPS
jgi:alkane 1-monooxygenase